jgi:hypothetical protein
MPTLCPPLRARASTASPLSLSELRLLSLRCIGQFVSCHESSSSTLLAYGCRGRRTPTCCSAAHHRHTAIHCCCCSCRCCGCSCPLQRLCTLPRQGRTPSKVIHIISRRRRPGRSAHHSTCPPPSRSTPLSRSAAHNLTTRRGSTPLRTLRRLPRGGSNSQVGQTSG